MYAMKQKITQKTTVFSRRFYVYFCINTRIYLRFRRHQNRFIIGVDHKPRLRFVRLFHVLF